jgi:RHS repeat-associated protein
MTQAVAGGVTTNYVYDAEGRRVKKTSGTTVTRYVYGISGELVAEYTGSTPVQSKEYVSGPTGLLLVVDTPGASQTLRYVTPDNLGTPRLHTSAGPTPSVLGRFDYMPFGEEIFGTSTPQSFNAGRTTAMGYTASDTTASQKVRQKFTSKERDAETGLDYFGARYFSRSQGRFTSADPILIKKARLMDPQRINLYAYARNSPLEYIDPNGADIMLAKDLTPEDKSYAVKHLARLYSTSKGKAYLERADKSQFDVLITVGKLPRTTEGDKTHITGGITAYGVRTDLETGQRSLNAGGPPYLENVAPITVTIDPNNVKAMGMDPAKTFAHEIGGHTANVLNLAERVDPASGQMGLDISPLDKKQDEDSSQDAEDIGDLPKDPSPEAMKAVETLLMPREEPRPE